MREDVQGCQFWEYAVVWSQWSMPVGSCGCVDADVAAAGS